MTWNDTQGETLSHKCDVRHCASTDGARRAQNCALYTSVCFVVSVPLFAMWSRLFMSVCRSQMFVNMRCKIHSLYMMKTNYAAKGTTGPPDGMPNLVSHGDCVISKTKASHPIASATAFLRNLAEQTTPKSLLSIYGLRARQSR